MQVPTCQGHCSNLLYHADIAGNVLCLGPVQAQSRSRLWVLPRRSPSSSQSQSAHSQTWCVPPVQHGMQRPPWSFILHMQALSAFHTLQVAKARSMLPEHIRVLELPHETPYIRDTAPLVWAHLCTASISLHCWPAAAAVPRPERPVQPCRLQFVVRGAEGVNGGGEVAAVQFRFNAYGAKQNPDGSWQSKYGTLYATDMADARWANTVSACLVQRSLFGEQQCSSRWMQGLVHHDVAETKQCALKTSLPLQGGPEAGCVGGRCLLQVAHGPGGWLSAH